MGRIRRGLQRVADQVARRVAQDDLFEKAGERAHTSPLPPRSRPAPSATGPAAPADPPVPTARPSAPAGSSSCQLADLAHLQQALGPGDGPRVVNHWATWCAPCIEELPHLVQLAADLGQDASVLGISWDLFDPRGGPEQVAAQVAEFATQHGLTWPSLLVSCDPSDFFAAFEIGWEKIPQTWVLAADGSVLERFEGVIDADQCARIAALIRES